MPLIFFSVNRPEGRSVAHIELPMNILTSPNFSYTFDEVDVRRAVRNTEYSRHFENIVDNAEQALALRNGSQVKEPSELAKAILKYLSFSGTVKSEEDILKYCRQYKKASGPDTLSALVELRQLKKLSKVTSKEYFTNISWENIK